LNRHGVEVVVPKKIRCCGSLNHHLGKGEDANLDFINNIETWYEEHRKGNLDAILSNTSGCGTTLKDYGFIFREDKKIKEKAKIISSLSKDVSEYLSDNLKLKFKIKNKKYKIAYHSACSMQHGQKVHIQPFNLLSKTQNEIIEIPNGHLCCGSAGTYNILQSEIASKLLKDKVKNIETINPQIISTGNIGCITQISNGTNIPILHTVEILDWYTGGPKPEILKNI
tara:strand:+ start:1485 stop:2162 length:678 start_codon:yes stop_codon:yes gene_type:complete